MQVTQKESSLLLNLCFSGS